jgi:hypothetical protein
LAKARRAFLRGSGPLILEDLVKCRPVRNVAKRSEMLPSARRGRELRELRELLELREPWELPPLSRI